MQLDKLTKKARGAFQDSERITWSLLGWFHIKFLPLLGVLISALYLTGCETLDKPSPAQLAAIKSGKVSIVLLRTTLTETNKGFTITKGPYFEYKIVNLNGTEIASRHLFDIPFVPSTPEEKPGWKYFMLESGDYYFRQELPLGYTINLTNSPVTFHVPTNAPMLYVGSFCYGLETLPKPSLWATLITEDLPRYRLHYLGLNDESSQAAQIAKTWLIKEFGPPLTYLAMPYDDLPSNYINWTNCRITQVESDCGAKFTSSDVGTEATGKAVLPLVAPMLIAGGAMLDASTNDVGARPNATTDSEMVVVGSALALASAPIIFIADKTFGDAARKKWKPYETNLAKKFTEFGFTTNLDRVISSQVLFSGNLTGGNTNQLLGQELTLKIETYRAMLRQTRLHKYALEIAVKVTLKDFHSGALLYQHNFVYTDYAAAMADSNSFLLPGETPIAAQSEVCKLQQYESSPGAELLQNQLVNAVAVISKDIVNRLRNAGIGR